jgi:hypothetical protein
MDCRWPRRLALVGLGFWLAGVVGCGGGGAPPIAAPMEPALDADVPAEEASDAEAEEFLAALEARLLDAPRLELRSEILVTGAMEGALAGTLVVSAGGSVAIEFEGELGGRAVKPHLVATGDTMSGGDGSAGFDAARPPALAEGLIVGLVRMGILHNLAMLSAGRPPDGADGGVRDWVTVTELALGPVERPDELGGRAARPLSFEIVVGGQAAGEATVWVAEGSGLPLLRRQTVRFSQGTMEVEERYEWAGASPRGR